MKLQLPSNVHLTEDILNIKILDSRGATGSFYMERGEVARKFQGLHAEFLSYNYMFKEVNF